MPVWRSHRDPVSHEQAIHRARLNHPSTGRLGHEPVDPPVLNDEDWAGIEALLARDDGVADTKTCDLLVPLFTSLDNLAACVRSQPVVAAAYVTNCLLDVWAAASDIDEQLARPVEEYLSALVGRDLATAAEVVMICESMRAAAGARP